MEFKNGDTVIYGIHGVCTVLGIEAKEFMGKQSDYYVLAPTSDTRSTVFVPTDNELLVSKIKRIMKPSEIYGLIRQMQTEENIWIESDAERKRKYAEILKSGDRVALVRLIKTLYLHREKQSEAKKKLHASDESFLRDAEKLLYEEFAHVLNITNDQVLPFIMRQIEIEER